MRGDACEIHLITMVRNEADVLPAFLARASILFDKTFIVDHQSTDGTRAALDQAEAACDRIKVFDYDCQAYYQSEISNRLARHAIKEGADWVFFLDADEFLDVADRAGLEALVKSFSHEVMFLRWINLVPTEFGSFTNFDAGQTFRRGEKPSRYGKIALNATFAAKHPRFHVAQGNHAVSPSRSREHARALEGGSILHAPIRSLDRLRYKLAAGMRAYQAKAGSNPIEGFHWFELHDRLEQGAATPEWINGVIAQYGEPLSGIKPVNAAGEEWTDQTIPGPSESRFGGSAASLAGTIEADARVEWAKLTAVDGAPLRADLDGRRVVLKPQPMCFDGEDFEGAFAKLPAETAVETAAFDDGRLAEAVSRAFLSVKTVVPSAWSEHAPFLFSLFSLIHPRRYVEIGSHWGMSFFAAGQAAEQLEIGTQCVAVDGWLGDEHAGFYDDGTFANFKANLKSLGYRNGYYIRSFFEQSLQCFDEGSIDLLHIDGLHTYEAVKNDYESWLPKMSDRGVIIFHDTNVYERGFGVWRLWNELKARHPHFHLPHCHGLGVIYVGAEPSPTAELLRRLERDEGLATAAISLFGGVGAMSIRNSLLEQQLAAARAESESRSAEAAQLRAALRAVWTSTSWRMSKVVRVVGGFSKQMGLTTRRGA